MKTSILPGARKTTPQTMFYDGFDTVVQQHQSIKDAHMQAICDAYPSAFFTDENSERVVELHLMRGQTIVRYLVIDASYTVYLMSDTGKTIEKFFI